MEKVKKPFLKKWRLGATAAVLVLAIAASSGCTISVTETAPPSSPSPDQSTQSEPTAEPEPTVEPESTVEPEPTGPAGYRPGDSFENNGLTITYQECDSNWTGYSQYLGPSSGNKIVRAYFVFENTGNSDQSCGSWEFDCYADGTACQAFYFSGDDDLPGYNTISAGRNMKGYVYFEVPEGAEVIELEYELSVWTQEKAIFIVE